MFCRSLSRTGVFMTSQILYYRVIFPFDTNTINTFRERFFLITCTSLGNFMFYYRFAEFRV